MLKDKNKSFLRSSSVADDFLEGMALGADCLVFFFELKSLFLERILIF